jgi:hypothetical protein
LSAIKPRYEVVEVAGFGTVGLRSVSQLQLSRRYASYCDPATGAPLPGANENSTVDSIIDTVYVNEKEPMFTAADREALLEADSAKLQPLLEAIDKFNGGTEKNGQSG